MLLQVEGIRVNSGDQVSSMILAHYYDSLLVTLLQVTLVSVGVACLSSLLQNTCRCLLPFS